MIRSLLNKVISNILIHTRKRYSMIIIIFLTGEWSLAASHLKRSIVAIQAQFGEDSIELGQQLFKLTQLHFNG